MPRRRRGRVGLAVARALADAGREVVVIDAADGIGNESSRNSEVIHAGIYYAPGTLKATLCVPAAAALRLLRGARRRAPALRQARSSRRRRRRSALRAHRRRGAANGVADMRWLDGAEAMRARAGAHCVAALLSPSTGIVDSHALMLACQGDLGAGARARAAPPLDARSRRAAASCCDVGGEAPLRARERHPRQRRRACDAPRARARSTACAGGVPRRVRKGNYFALAGRAPFTRLIYPVPEPGGLGVHLTLDLAGQARFGPDVEWLDGRQDRLRRRSAPRDASTPRSGAIGRGCRTARCAGLQRRAAEDRAGPATPAPDFMMRGRRSTACRGW